MISLEWNETSEYLKSSENPTGPVHKRTPKENMKESKHLLWIDWETDILSNKRMRIITKMLPDIDGEAQ